MTRAPNWAGRLEFGHPTPSPLMGSEPRGFMLLGYFGDEWCLSRDFWRRRWRAPFPAWAGDGAGSELVQTARRQMGVIRG